MCLVEQNQLVLANSAKVLSANGKTCLSLQLNEHWIIHFPFGKCQDGNAHGTRCLA